MAKFSWRFYTIALCCFVPAFLFGCGGGETGGGSSVGGPSFPTKTLSWNPPTVYQDGSSLDPATELDRFEIYIKETPVFADTDDEMAALSAIDQATGRVCTSFDLANLSPFLSTGVTYYTSIRAVANNGMKSEFSASATFSF